MRDDEAMNLSSYGLTLCRREECKEERSKLGVYARILLYVRNDRAEVSRRSQPAITSRRRA